MMDITQKIAELIRKAKLSMWGKSGLSCELARNTHIAEYLVANGVTVLDEPLKMAIPEDIDREKLLEMLHKTPLQILPCEPVQEWISVKDRLPEECGFYICFFRSPYVNDCWRVGQCHWNEESWVRIGSVPPHVIVTHWMPLPEPPKEVQE